MSFKIRTLVLALVFGSVCPMVLAGGKHISKQDVIQAQQQWGSAIVRIGKAYTGKKDFKAEATNVVDNLYAFQHGTVLFKPTKALEDQFRLKRDEAISYFVGGIVKEDKGFAIQPWTKVRFENADILLLGESALAMGNYFFTDAKSGKEVKVEYTFGYVKDSDGKLRINLHHSSIPFNPGG